MCIGHDFPCRVAVRNHHGWTLLEMLFAMLFETLFVTAEKLFGMPSETLLVTAGKLIEMLFATLFEMLFDMLF